MIKKKLLPVFLLLFYLFNGLHASPAARTHKKKSIKKTTSTKNNKSTRHDKKQITKSKPFCLPQEVVEQSTEFKRKIRVLIDNEDLTKDKKITLRSKEGFILESPSGSGTTVLYQEPEVTILQQGKQLFLRCKDEKYRRIKYNSIDITAVNNKLYFEKNAYPGTISIVNDDVNNSLLVVNKLDLEDYVYCVLSSESIPSWPLEMHKIQAIACRTYAVFCMQQAIVNKQKNPYYDIGNTNSHQIYRGLHNVTHLRNAVDQTRNLILTYNGQIALTMFDICCGGIIPGKLRYRDTSKPYLCRTQPCQYCKCAPSYHWRQDLAFAFLEQQLKNSPRMNEVLKDIGDNIADVKVIDKDSAGVVYKVKLCGNKRCASINMRDLSAILSNGHRLKSKAFTLHAAHGKLIFSGNGDGHHIGLCQWGAKHLLEQGWSLKRILNFYYPRTTLSRLVS